MQDQIITPRDIPNGVRCSKQSGDIVVHSPVPVFDPGIPPANGEDLEAILDQVFHHALSGGQIEHVKFVHFRRYEKMRTRTDCVGRRTVLDQLQDGVAEHDGARHDCEIYVWPEGRLVYLRRHALILDDIVDEVLEPSDKIRAVGLNQSFSAHRGCQAANSSGRKPRSTPRRQSAPAPCCRRQGSIGR